MKNAALFLEKSFVLYYLFVFEKSLLKSKSAVSYFTPIVICFHYKDDQTFPDIKLLIKELLAMNERENKI